MEYRLLGRTGLRVSEVGFGCWAIGGPATLGEFVIGWGKVDDATSLRALQAALDEGINFFDTADVYGLGHSEELVGKAFSGKRDQVIIATKVGNRVTQDNRWIKDFSPEWIATACEASLKRLRTDRIDVYQLHSPRSDFEYSDDVVGALERLRRAGKIRHFGISLPGDNADVLGLRVIREGKPCEVFQLVHNILQREAEDELLPACMEADIGVIARVPLASGFLTGKFTAQTTFAPDDHRSRNYPPERVRDIVGKVARLRELVSGSSSGKNLAQLALQYCLSQPAVSVVIPGAKTPEQVRENAAASDGRLLSPEEVARIRALVPADQGRREGR